MDTEKKDKIKEIVEWIICIIIAMTLALLVRHFVFTPTVVNMQSMQNTLMPKDRLILDRWSITTNKEIKRGEIITFERPSAVYRDEITYNEDYPVAEYNNEPSNIFSSFIYYGLELNKVSYIKRVIAVEGDHILIENGRVYLNGELLQEDYLKENIKTERTGPYYNLTVPKGYVFAMGDNREESSDCREFGCIPIEKIESKVFIRFWPFTKFGKV